MIETNFENQKSLLVQKNTDGTFIVGVGKQVFSGIHVGINFENDGEYFAGMDDPLCLEFYNQITFDCTVYVEDDETISIDIRI